MPRPEKLSRMKAAIPASFRMCAHMSGPAPIPPDPWIRMTAGIRPLVPNGSRSSPPSSTPGPFLSPRKNASSSRVCERMGRISIRPGQPLPWAWVATGAASAPRITRPVVAVFARPARRRCARLCMDPLQRLIRSGACAGFAHRDQEQGNRSGRSRLATQAFGKRFDDRAFVSERRPQHVTSIGPRPRRCRPCATEPLARGVRPS